MFIASIGLLITPGVVAAAPLAFAQGTGSKAASREHFNKGVAAFDAKRFGEAGDEFNEAYRLSPAFAVLYNIGQVNVALGRSVEAVDAYEKYLKQGASMVAPQRRQQVEAEIDRQRARIGTIVVRTIPDGAEVRIDGASSGKTPLPGPVRVTAGRHVVEATLPERIAQFRELDVAGRAEIVLELRLEPVALPVPPPNAAVPAPAPVAPPPSAHETRAAVTAAHDGQSRESRSERPAIEKIVIETPSPAPRPVPQSSVNWQRVGGVLIMVGGVALTTWGGIEVYRGITQTNDARDRLSQATPTTPNEVWDRDLADFNAGKDLSKRGWITAGIGAGALLGGIVLVVTAPEKQTNLALAPWLMAEGGGLVAHSTW